MRKDVRTYQLSLELYQRCKSLMIPDELRDSLIEASSAVVLNVAEGAVRATAVEQRRYYAAALGKLRHYQAILEHVDCGDEKARLLAERIGAHLHNVCHGQALVV